MSKTDIAEIIAGRAERARAKWPSEKYSLTRYAARIAVELDSRREAQGLSLQQLADQAGTSKAQVVRVLSGNYTGITSHSLVRMARALGCEPVTTFRPVRPRSILGRELVDAVGAAIRGAPQQALTAAKARRITPSRNAERLRPGRASAARSAAKR